MQLEMIKIIQVIIINEKIIYIKINLNFLIGS